MLGEPRDRGTAGIGEACPVRVEVTAVDGDQLLGLQRLLVGAQRQVRDGDGVVQGGEAGLAGLSVSLVGPGGTSTAATLADGSAERKNWRLLPSRMTLPGIGATSEPCATAEPGSGKRGNATK